MTTATATPRPTYGNWVKQRSPGLGGVGVLGMVVGLGGGLLTIFAMLIGGLKVALVVLAFVVVLFLLAGTPLGIALAEVVGFLRSKKAAENQWRSGVFSFNSDPSTRLPGVLGTTTLLTREDVFGGEFVVVKNPLRGGLYTVIVRCMAEGPSMQDQDQINNWVAGWSAVLTNSSQENGLVCAKAISDTAPDPGGRLEAQVRSQRSASSPDVARRVMDEIVSAYPAASSDNVTYVEFTFRGRALSKRGRDEEILSELARKVPGMMGLVEQAGGGSVEMLDAATLTKIVRAAYDPAAQKFIEQAELDGIESDLTWKDAGPVADQNLWDRYVHDSGVSVTWEMREPPRAAVHELALSGLMYPHRDFVRKRVALLYRPHSPEEGMKTAERDAQTATFVATSGGKRRVPARARLVERATEQTREEIAQGHSLVRFSMLITATVASSEDLPQAISTIEGRASAAQLRLRRSYGSQAPGFAATLPVGMVPWEHTVVPTSVMDLI